MEGMPGEDPWEMDGSYEDGEERAWFEDPLDEMFLAPTRYPRWPFSGLPEPFEDVVSPFEDDVSLFEDDVSPFDNEVDSLQTQGEILQPYR